MQTEDVSETSRCTGDGGSRSGKQEEVRVTTEKDLLGSSEQEWRALERISNLFESFFKNGADILTWAGPPG